MSLEVAHIRPGGESLETFAPQAAEGSSAEEAMRLAAANALENPLGFPPIVRAVTPDDYVAIALGDSTPSAGAVVAGVIGKLVDCGLDRARMAVVTVNEVVAESLREELVEEASAGVKIESHDPSDEDSLCFAGLTKSERQLRMNRWLFDADVLLPVSVEDTADVSGIGGPFDGLFPAFFDQETIRRVERVRGVTTARARGGDHARARRREADEAGWLAGIPMVVRVVPGSGDAPARVLAGEPNEVQNEAARLSQDLWTAACPPAPSLLIAKPRVGGAGEGRRWVDIGRTLEALERVAEPGTVIALWTEIDEPVGEQIGKLRESDNPARIAESLLDESGSEALAAWRIARALDRGAVYLRSRQDADLIEDLGFTPIASEEELSRLAERHERPFVIDDAQHVRFALAED